MELKYNIVKKLYLSNRIGQKIAEMLFLKREGGQFYSKTLRRIFKEEFDIEVGVGTYGCFTDTFRPHMKVGNYCSIASGVHRLVGNHPMTNISTHPIFYKKEFGGVAETKYDYHSLEIGNDVWIGVNTVITGKCEYIGNGAVIGAGSIVTHNVEPYSIVAGNPAKVLRFRFDKETIKKIEDSRWWNLSVEQLQKIAEYANDIDQFVMKVKEIRTNG